MTTLAKRTVACGSCGRLSDQTVLNSTNAFGSPDLDLRPPEMQRSTMPFWLQRCPHCGYCAPELEKAPADPRVLVSEPYRSALQRGDVPELAQRFLAYALTLSPSDPAAAGQVLLRAAWVCDDARRHEQADECRRRAAEMFKQRKPFSGEEGVTIGAVLVDVLRRAGQFADAKSECSALLGAPEVSGLLRDVLEYQQRLIEREDRRAHSVSESRPS